MLKMTCWENYASILVWILSWSLSGHLIKLCMYTYSGCLTLNILQKKKKKKIRFLYFSGLDFKAIKFFSWSTLSSLLILHIAKSAGIRKLFVGFCWLFIQNIILYLPVQFCGLRLSTKAKKEIVFDFQVIVFELAVEHSCLLLEILYPMSVIFWASLTFLECIWVKYMLQAPLVSVIKDVEIWDAVN